MRLKDKVAIITGAGQSQGRAATLLFAQEGAKVVAADWHGDEVEETARMVREAGNDATAIKIDVRKEAEVEKMVKLAVETYGKLDILYNNAAVDVYGGPCTGIEEKTLDFVQNVDFKGYFWGCKKAIPEMIRAGGGSIVNISSIAGIVGDTGCDAYAGAKGGVISLTNAIASEFASKNVRCNVIIPGAVKSEGHKHLVNDPEKAVDLFRWFIGPMVRIGEPLEIAHCALYLASDESTFTTGAHIVIDGGLTKSLKRPDEESVQAYVEKYLESLK